jgi:hypothetical protein
MVLLRTWVFQRLFFLNPTNKDSLRKRRLYCGCVLASLTPLRGYQKRTTGFYFNGITVADADNAGTAQLFKEPPAACVKGITGAVEINVSVTA